MPLIRLIRLIWFGCWITMLASGVAIAEDQVAPKQLEVGDRAIDFDLPVVGGEEYLTLRDEFKEGPVVVIVLRGYPGYQCPLCSEQVSSIRNRARALASVAHRVILVYPGQGTRLQRQAKQFMGSRSLPDPLVIVRDQEMKMVTEWGLRWDTPRETAYPAAYIIDRNGRVRWLKVSDNHAGRASVDEIVRELRKL
jgi:peroxiredoxin